MTTVYVSNLPPDTMENELRELLEEVGGIRSLQILGERGPAVCDFFDPAAAGVARRSLDGNIWNESKLEVRYTYELSAEERKPCEAQVSTEVHKDNVSGPEMVQVSYPDDRGNKEKFASEKTVNHIMHNLPGLGADISNGEAISEDLGKLSPEQVLEVLHAAQDAAMIDSKVLKQVLVEHPALTRALFGAQLNSNLVKVPEDSGVEVEKLMEQLLEMLKPRPKQTPETHPVRSSTYGKYYGDHDLGNMGKHGTKTMLKSKPLLLPAKRQKFRHQPDRNLPKATAGQQFSNHALVSASRNSITMNSTSQQRGLPRNVVFPQQQQSFPTNLGPAARMIQGQIPSNQMAVQQPHVMHHQSKTTLGGHPGALSGGRFFISPVQQTSSVQQAGVIPGALILNQVHMAGTRPQVSVIGNNQQRLGPGVWQPHELSSIPKVRPPVRGRSMDASTLLASRGNLNAYGGLSSGQLAQQGWIVRPQTLLQQPHIILQPGQAIGTTYPAGMQVTGLQGVTGDGNASQIAGNLKQ